MTASKNVTLTRVAPGTLSYFHRNPRVGDVDAIAESLLASDQYKPIVVNKGTHTGRPNEVLVGNHTLKAIGVLAERHPEDARWKTVLVHTIDVSDDAASRIVLSDNRTPELGSYDDGMLLSLLEDLDGLDGSGYDDDDLTDLQALLQEVAPEGPFADDETVHVEFDAAKKPREDGLLGSNPISEDAKVYEEKATRLIVLTLPIPQFIWAQAKLEEYREQTGSESNSAVLLELLSSWSGEAVPSSDEEPAAENPFAAGE